VLLDAARGARLVVEIGVYEGSSAVLLCAALGPAAELHLIDPFGRRPDALPSRWAGTEWATRRVVARASRRRGAQAPRVRWHIALSHEVAACWSGEADLVFIDGDHSEAGCELDWSCWHRFVPVGGHIVFHDARADRPDGRGLPGPTAVVSRRFRARERTGRDQPGCERDGGSWELVAEADRTVAVRRVG
jgi:predicted O-methyltransferase YrrM